jgi:hypothetical protein
MTKRSMIAVLVCLGAVFILVPCILDSVRARNTHAYGACFNNLRQLDGCKDQWMLENHKTTNDVPTMKELLPYMRAEPKCPRGGTYILGRAGEPSRCSIHGTIE